MWTKIDVDIGDNVDASTGFNSQQKSHASAGTSEPEISEPETSEPGNSEPNISEPKISEMKKLQKL